jgi:hypothetical protein
MAAFCLLLNNHRTVARKRLTAQRSHLALRHYAHSVKWAPQHELLDCARIAAPARRPPVGGVAQAPGPRARLFQYRYSPRRIKRSTLGKFRAEGQSAACSIPTPHPGGIEVVPVGKIRAKTEWVCGLGRGGQRLPVRNWCGECGECGVWCIGSIGRSGPMDRLVAPPAPVEKEWVPCAECQCPENCWNRGCLRDWQRPPSEIGKHGLQPRECRWYPKCGCDYDGACEDEALRLAAVPRGAPRSKIAPEKHVLGAEEGVKP